MIIAYLKKSHDGRTKYVVVLDFPGGKKRTVRFGAHGYSDYTKHKNRDRMLRYLKRHRYNENWTRNGIGTRGFWSRWLLWHKPSITNAIASTERKFNIKITRRAPP